MADAVTSQLYDGARNVVLNLNSVSDGTGQAGVIIVDPISLIPNPSAHLVLWRCSYDVKGGSLNIQWGGTPNKSLVTMAGNYARDFSPWGGLRNDATAATGQVLITTVGFLTGSGYSAALEFKKGAPGGPGLGAFLLNVLPLITPEMGLPTAAPVNRDVPYLSGEGNIGEILTCTMGNWDNTPRSYEFLWLRDGIISKLDTSSSIYLVTNNDIGHTITCIVTAVNIYGSVAAPPSNAVTVASNGTNNGTRSRQQRIPLRK